jgi:altronate hydrolase
MKNKSKETIRLHPDDNVMVAIVDLPSGTKLTPSNVVCLNTIPAGHKIAIQPLKPGEPILKYGQIIGFASKAILQGEHVHTQNVEMADFDRDYAFGADAKPTDMIPAGDRATFKGIIRENGRVGTRNYIGVLATVSCSVSVVKWIEDAFTEEVMARYPNVDGVVALGHGGGCAAAPDNEGFIFLQRVMAGYARHPNFAGVLMVGLGCEGNHMDCLLNNTGLESGPFLKTLNIQTSGGSTKTVEEGVLIVKKMLERADQVERTDVSAKNLVVGLECGGSDAYSGITANPVLGAAVDLLVGHGGTAILSETPEIYGAEQLLTRRANSRAIGERLVERIRWWESHTARFGGNINNNPTPGNKAGGLTTILEKSLGAAAKGGSTDLMMVYGYGEAVSAKGLVFMDTPGYDPVSVTGMIAGGANVVCFTTGRGTVCGFKPVPTLKLASNTAMYERLKDDMDVNCGGIVEGSAGIQGMGEKVFDLILKTASGRPTRSEKHGFGDNEFVPWHFGPVM